MNWTDFYEKYMHLLDDTFLFEGFLCNFKGIRVVHMTKSQKESIRDFSKIHKIIGSIAWEHEYFSLACYRALEEVYLQKSIDSAQRSDFEELKNSEFLLPRKISASKDFKWSLCKTMLMKECLWTREFHVLAAIYCKMVLYMYLRHSGLEECLIEAEKWILPTFRGTIPKWGHRSKLKKFDYQLTKELNERLKTRVHRVRKVVIQIFKESEELQKIFLRCSRRF